MLKRDKNVYLIETTRLIGRQFTFNDLPDLTAILSDAEVMKYSLHGIYDEAATSEFIEWCMTCYNTQGFGPWALIEKTSSALLGFCGIYPEKLGNVQEVGLGYRLARNYWGKGLASEAGKATVEFAFTQKKVDSIVVIIEPQHIASIRVAEKLGFKDFNIIDFNEHLVRLYRLNKNQWQALYKNSESF